MREARRIPPLHADVFARVFGAEGSKGAALALANAVLRAAGEPELARVDEVSAERTLPGGALLKSPRLDVVLRCEGRFVDLEAQRRPTRLLSRSMLYASRLIADHAPKGDPDYARVPEVAVITLLDGPAAFEGGQFLTAGRVHWEREGGWVGAGSQVVLVCVELAKFRKRYNRLDGEVLADELLAWLYLLTKGYGSEDDMAEMMTTFEAIKEFAREYGRAIDDPDLERDYWRWYESEIEWNSAISYAADQARAEALAEAAARLRELGVDESVIAQVRG